MYRSLSHAPILSYPIYYFLFLEIDDSSSITDVDDISKLSDDLYWNWNSRIEAKQPFLPYKSSNIELDDSLYKPYIDDNSKFWASCITPIHLMTRSKIRSHPKFSSNKRCKWLCEQYHSLI